VMCVAFRFSLGGGKKAGEKKGGGDTSLPYLPTNTRKREEKKMIWSRAASPDRANLEGKKKKAEKKGKATGDHRQGDQGDRGEKKGKSQGTGRLLQRGKDS